MTTVQVSLGDRSYPIRIRSGSLADLGETLAGTPGLGRVVVVSAPPLAETHAANLCRGLGRAGLSFEQLEVPDGERAKTLRTAARLYDRLIEQDSLRRAADDPPGRSRTARRPSKRCPWC